MRRITAFVAVAIGLGLIVFTLATSLYSRTEATERITDTYRAQMSSEGLASTREDYDLIASGREQFTGEVVPALAKQLDMNAEEFNAFVAENFPAVPAAVATFPMINSFVGPFIADLEDNQETFESADSLPLLDLPLDATPWLIAGLGAAIALAGVAALLTTSRVALIVLLCLGVAAVVVPLVASIPSKASDADTMVDLGGKVLNPEAAAFAEDTTTKVDALVRQVTTEMVPALAERFDTTPAAFAATLARDFPDASRLLTVWPQRLTAKAHAIAARMSKYSADLEEADAIPLKALAWVVVIPGLVLTVLAGFALFGGRGRSSPRPA